MNRLKNSRFISFVIRWARFGHGSMLKGVASSPPGSALVTCGGPMGVTVGSSACRLPGHDPLLGNFWSALVSFPTGLPPAARLSSSILTPSSTALGLRCMYRIVTLKLV